MDRIVHDGGIRLEPGTLRLPSDVSRSTDRSTINIALLGATGSIGTATVDVVRNLNQVDDQADWRFWAISGHQNVDQLFQIADSLDDPAAQVIVSDPDASANGRPVTVGPDALVAAAADSEVDTVVAAIVGRAGLESTLAAIEAGKRVALANKETLVVAGPVVERALASRDAELLPVDSDHSAIFQCLGSGHDEPKKLILTASGGPFRTWTTEQMRAATRESALAHPTWQMGDKITIDSATMMNKSLEIIEARWLFGFAADAIEVVVHPQSIVHSMVEYADGSVIAQLSPPDMRLPIQYALTYPRRLPSPSPALDRTEAAELTFEPADRERFPALDLGFEVAEVGGTAGAVLNAANEEAVGLFLDGQILFTDIVAGCRDVLRNHTFEPQPSLSRLLDLDRWARSETRRRFKV